VALLWAAHAVHHQSEDYNLGTALRQTSSGFLLGWVAPDGSVAIARSVDGWRWTRASLLAGWRSANAPVLAEARWGDACAVLDSMAVELIDSGNDPPVTARLSCCRQSVWWPMLEL
jgi:hypothetical protein